MEHFCVFLVLGSICCLCRSDEEVSSNKYLTNYEIVPINFTNSSNEWDKIKSAESKYFFTFDAFSKTFDGVLATDYNGITNKETKINMAGMTESLHQNMAWSIMKGYLENDKDSYVYGMIRLELPSNQNHSIQPNAFLGWIQTKDVSYGIEPHKWENDTLLVMVYRDEDFADPNCNESRCSGMEPYFDEMISYFYSNTLKVVRSDPDHSLNASIRLRGKDCGVDIALGVAFIKANENDRNQSLAWVILMMTMVNKALRQTDFDNDGYAENIGVFIQQISINRGKFDKSESNKEKMLKSYLFECARRNVKSCLTICLSHQHFGGLAGMASNPNMIEGNKNTGICAKPARHKHDDKIREYTLNVAVITTNRGMTAYKAPVIQTTSIVLHHIGHMMGADHDPPNDSECNPPDASFVMTNRLDQIGKGSNAFSFSKCSTTKIWDHLETHSDCFSASSKPFCGNGIVERGEECDCGNSIECDDVDPCCVPMGGLGGQTGCNIRELYQCTPINHTCCTDECMFRTQGYTCENSTNPCQKNSVCDGMSSKCPPKPHSRRGTTCLSQYRTCRHGRCSSNVCLDNRKEECDCTKYDELCLLCCKEIKGICRPSYLHYFPSSPDPIFRPTGFSCNGYLGVCDMKHECNPITHERSKTVGEWFSTYWPVLVIIFLVVFLVLVKKL